jgi:hypothetical protein
MNYGFLGRYCLPPESLLSSGKLLALDTLLRDLKARGSRCGWAAGGGRAAKGGALGVGRFGAGMGRRLGEVAEL